MDFAALRMSAYGTSRRFAVTRRLVAIGGIADMNGRIASANSVEIDPSLPLSDQFCCYAQQPSRATGVVMYARKLRRGSP